MMTATPDSLAVGQTYKNARQRRLELVQIEGDTLHLRDLITQTVSKVGSTYPLYLLSRPEQMAGKGAGDLNMAKLCELDDDELDELERLDTREWVQHMIDMCRSGATPPAEDAEADAVLTHQEPDPTPATAVVEGDEDDRDLPPMTTPAQLDHAHGTTEAAITGYLVSLGRTSWRRGTVDLIARLLGKAKDLRDLTSPTKDPAAWGLRAYADEIGADMLDALQVAHDVEATAKPTGKLRASMLDLLRRRYENAAGPDAPPFDRSKGDAALDALEASKAPQAPTVAPDDVPTPAAASDDVTVPTMDDMDPAEQVAHVPTARALEIIQDTEWTADALRAARNAERAAGNRDAVVNAITRRLADMNRPAAAEAKPAKVDAWSVTDHCRKFPGVARCTVRPGAGGTVSVRADVEQGAVVVRDDLLLYLRERFGDQILGVEVRPFIARTDTPDDEDDAGEQADAPRDVVTVQIPGGTITVDRDAVEAADDGVVLGWDGPDLDGMISNGVPIDQVVTMTPDGDVMISSADDAPAYTCAEVDAAAERLRDAFKVDRKDRRYSSVAVEERPPGVTTDDAPADEDTDDGPVNIGTVNVTVGPRLSDADEQALAIGRGIMAMKAAGLGFTIHSHDMIGGEK